MTERFAPSPIHMMLHGRIGRRLPGAHRVEIAVPFGDPARLERMFAFGYPNYFTNAVDISAEMRAWLAACVGPEFETWVASVAYAAPYRVQKVTVVLRDPNAAVLVKMMWS